MKNFNVKFTLKDDQGTFKSKTHRLQAPDIRGLFTQLSLMPIFYDVKVVCTGLTVKEIEA